MSRIAVAVALSVVAHAAAALALAATMASVPPLVALFVDLTRDETAAAPGGGREVTGDGVRAGLAAGGTQPAGRQVAPVRRGREEPRRAPPRATPPAVAGRPPEPPAASFTPDPSARSAPVPPEAEAVREPAPPEPSALSAWRPPLPPEPPRVDSPPSAPVAAPAPAPLPDRGASREAAGPVPHGTSGSSGAVSGQGPASERDGPAAGVVTAGESREAGSRASGGPARVGDGSGDVALAVPGGGGAGEYAGYLALVRGRIQESLRYPLAARRRGLSGTVEVELTIQPSGAIGAVEVVRSSSHRVLDDAAVDAVRSLGRVPFPSGVAPRTVRARVPVVFDLR